MPRYKVTLTAEEKAYLTELYNTGTRSNKAFKYARALLLCDQGEFADFKWSTEQTAAAVGITTRSLISLKERFVMGGLDVALKRKPYKQRQKVFDGDFEAKIIQIACSEAPEGRSRWTLQLIADKAVELKIVDSVSIMTVHRVLKKNVIKPHLKHYWKIPKEHNAEFVARMEDILDVYHRQPNLDFPLVCMDESCVQLVGEVREPIPMSPGNTRKIDDEYERKGTAEIFLAVAPLAGKRRVDVTEHRACVDWAHFMKGVSDEWFPEAKKIVLVMDNLNTHDVSSFYKAFEPAEAHRLAQRFEIHYTPKHGSWLNIAEIEFSAMKRQCLDRRIDALTKIRDEVEAWANDRNNRNRKVDWHFDNDSARVKLKHLYPELD